MVLEQPEMDIQFDKSGHVQFGHILQWAFIIIQPQLFLGI